METLTDQLHALAQDWPKLVRLARRIFSSLPNSEDAEDLLNGAYGQLLEEAAKNGSRPVQDIRAVLFQKMKWMISRARGSDGKWLPPDYIESINEGTERRHRLDPEEYHLMDRLRNPRWAELHRSPLSLAGSLTDVESIDSHEEGIALADDDDRKLIGEGRVCPHATE